MLFPCVLDSQYRLLFALPTMPHSRTALVTQVRYIPDRRNHLCKVTSRVEACVTASVLLQPSEPSMAPCSPLFLFPSSLHSHATLAIRPQRARYHSGHTYDISCGAEACVTMSNTSHPL